MPTVVVRVLLYLSATGWLLSVAVHLTALCGATPPGGEAAFALHIAAMGVIVPAGFMANKRGAESKSQDYWKNLLRDCPEWVKRGFYGSGLYAFINFAIFMWQAPPKGSHRPEDLPIVLRGFSGHWMAFFAAAFAIYYAQLYATPRAE